MCDDEEEDRGGGGDGAAVVDGDLQCVTKGNSQLLLPTHTG